MAIESAYRSAVSVKLKTAEQGAGAIKSCPLGKVVYGADKDKIMNVVAALLPVLEHPLYRVERTEVTVLEN